MLFHRLFEITNRCGERATDIPGVLDAATGQTVPGAIVRIRARLSPHEHVWVDATATDDGRYRFEAVPGGMSFSNGVTVWVQ